MAKTRFDKKIKHDPVYAEQFNAGLPKAQWPEGVVENSESPSGYSCGDINVIMKEEEYVEIDKKTGKEVKKTARYPDMEGFITYDTDYIVNKIGGNIFRMSESKFLERYEASS